VIARQKFDMVEMVEWEEVMAKEENLGGALHHGRKGVKLGEQNTTSMAMMIAVVV
jgi:hypothetical protein